ncbi:hypothetical protein BV25DRAFT_1827961 [Artomyces pyxidatus]|uniref:Uncharacterized protein n=1 Tax=Artomyces pyxidatus TaxID=48021 RepID=A0ACB8SW79_9AGAM|nr:hypothetical protein BV25DRAFT_1827961 [Artomyces pyxidatus]
MHIPTSTSSNLPSATAIVEVVGKDSGLPKSTQILIGCAIGLFIFVIGGFLLVALGRHRVIVSEASMLSEAAGLGNRRREEQLCHEHCEACCKWFNRKTFADPSEDIPPLDITAMPNLPPAHVVPAEW